MHSTKAALILQNYLRTSKLFTDPKKPNGLLLLGSRLNNSTKEDVIVDTLSADNETPQTGVLLVKAYAPALSLSFNGTWDYSQPNITRLAEIADLLNDVLKDYWHMGSFTSFEKVSDGGFVKDDNNQWFVGFRVKFISSNIKEN